MLPLSALVDDDSLAEAFVRTTIIGPTSGGMKKCSLPLHSDGSTPHLYEVYCHFMGNVVWSTCRAGLKLPWTRKYES